MSPSFAEAYLAIVPLTPVLLGAGLAWRRARRRGRTGLGAMQDVGVFLALVAFLPVPFVVPFFAASLVPILYVGAAPLVTRPYGPGLAVFTAIGCVVLYLIASPLSRGLARWRYGRVAFVGLAALLSLLPIYVFSLEQMDHVNILALFRQTRTWGQ